MTEKDFADAERLMEKYTDSSLVNPSNADDQGIHYIGYRRGVAMSEKERADTIEVVKKSIADEGGIEAWRRQNAVFAAAGRRFDQERKTLLEKHPYKWVAVNADGLLGVYDTIDEGLDTLDALGLRRDDYFLKYLDPRPISILAGGKVILYEEPNSETAAITESEYPDASVVVKKSIADAGGIEAWRRRQNVFAAAGRRFDQERKALLEKHPYKWVAVNADGLLGVYDTIDEALDALDDLGLGRSDYFLKYLDPIPMII